MKRTFILIAFSVLLSIHTYAQDTINFIDLREIELSKVQDSAKRVNRILFIYFTSNKCGPCQKLEKDVLINPEVTSFYNSNFICAKNEIIFLDGKPMRDKEFKKLNGRAIKNMEIFHENGFPSYFFINPNGEIIHKGSGYKTVSEFMEFGNNATDTTCNFISLKQKIDAGDISYQTLKKYLELIDLPDKNNDYKNESQKLLDKYFSNVKTTDYYTAENWYIIKNFVFNEQKDPLLYFFNNLNTFIEHFGIKEVNNCFYNKYRWATTGAGNSKRFKDAAIFFDNLNNSLVLADKKVLKYYYYSDDSMKIENMNELKDVFNEYYYIYDYVISDLSEKIYQEKQKKYLDIALNWMKLVTGEYNKSDYFNIYAHLLLLNGEKDRAIENQQKAIELAKSNGESLKQIEVLQKELDGMREN